MSLVVVEDDAQDTQELLIACENGFGKRTDVGEFNTQNRGGGGVIAIKTSERNGKLVRALRVEVSDDVILISNNGTLVRTPVAQIAQTGRNAQGVTLIRLGHDERLVSMARVEGSDDALIDDEMAASQAQDASDVAADEEYDLTEAMQEDGLLVNDELSEDERLTLDDADDA